MEHECVMQSRCGGSPSMQIRPTLPHLSTVDRLIPCRPGASADVYMKNSSKNKNTASQSASASKKRKAPDDISRHQSLVSVDPIVAITILGSILEVNASALKLLFSIVKEDSACAEVMSICARQDGQIMGLRGTLVDAIANEAPVEDGYAFFLKVSALLDSTSGLFPLLKHIPEAVSELLLKEDKLLYDLRYCCLYAAATPSAATAPESEEPHQTAERGELLLLAWKRSRSHFVDTKAKLLSRASAESFDSGNGMLAEEPGQTRPQSTPALSSSGSCQ